MKLDELRKVVKSRRFLSLVVTAIMLLLVVEVPPLEPLQEQLIELIVEVLSVL